MMSDLYIYIYRCLHLGASFNYTLPRIAWRIHTEWKIHFAGWWLTSAFHDGRSKEILQCNEETWIEKATETGAETEGRL